LLRLETAFFDFYCALIIAKDDYRLLLLNYKNHME